MKGSDILKIIELHHDRVAKHENEEVSLILVVGPGGIQLDALVVGDEQDKAVFQEHLVALLLKKLDGVKIAAAAPEPFITPRR